MSTKITTQFGHAVPPAPRHSVTVHMPGWGNVEKYGANSAAVIATFHNAYPRMKPHRDIANLAAAVLKKMGAENQVCYLFSSLQTALECVEFATDPRRDNGDDRKPVAKEQIETRAFVAKDRFFAVVVPLEKLPIVAAFWSTPGSGVSSRFAEANLSHLDKLIQVDVLENEAVRSRFEGPTHEQLRRRIAQYTARAPLNSETKTYPASQDVYLYPTGMGAIYKPHLYLTQSVQGTTVLFGMAFMNTLTAFADFGLGYQFFGLGGDEDLRDLEVFLQQEHKHGRKVQAIWAEFPANPILVTPNLSKLRALADEYDIVLAIDDTIGSWANIDIIGMVDILVTSLTKSFNGYADVMAGSAVLNPASRKYDQLKRIFDKHYVSELYVDDAEALEENSRDYLSRTVKLNHNAISLVQYLKTCAEDPKSAVREVHYPSVNASGTHYKRFMRPTTTDFTPGYGCLFSVEFEDLPSTIAFYNNLNVHLGPHLGAPFTLAFAYTMCAYKNRPDWAARYGLRLTQIRISAGLEDTAILLEDFRIAVEAADKARQAEP